MRIAEAVDAVNSAQLLELLDAEYADQLDETPTVDLTLTAIR